MAKKGKVKGEARQKREKLALAEVKAPEIGFTPERDKEPVPHTHELGPPVKVEFMARKRMPKSQGVRITPKMPKLER